MKRLRRLSLLKYAKSAKPFFINDSQCVMRVNKFRYALWDNFLC